MKIFSETWECFLSLMWGVRGSHMSLQLPDTNFSRSCDTIVIAKEIERLKFEIVTPVVVDTIVGEVVRGALEIVLLLLLHFDMTHEDSEYPFGDDQKTL